MASVIIPHFLLHPQISRGLALTRLSALRQEGTRTVPLTAMLMMSITGLMPIALKRRAHERSYAYESAADDREAVRARGYGAARALSSLLGLFGYWQPCQAADFTCTTPGDVQCLIAAITAANANRQANTITLVAGTYTLTTIHNGLRPIPMACR